MAVGASGRHGNLAACRVERDTGHEFAHVLIQSQNGTERIALGPISTQRAAICPTVKVDVLFVRFFREMTSAYFDPLLGSLVFILELRMIHVVYY